MRRRLLYITIATTKRQAARPPMTPPAMAPAWFLDEEDYLRKTGLDGSGVSGGGRIRTEGLMDVVAVLVDWLPDVVLVLKPGHIMGCPATILNV